MWRKCLPNLSNSTAKQFWSLIDTGPNQESTVRATIDDDSETGDKIKDG